MQLLNLFYLVLLTIQSLSAQQSSWFSNGKAFLASHKKAATRVLQAALRRPSIATAVAAVGSALYNRAPKARAETIFVARDTEGNPRDITPEEHEKLYDIKLKSQFPTAQCYANYDPTANEIEVIQKKVDATFGDKNIEAVWVPDVVYHLSAIDKEATGEVALKANGELERQEDLCKLNNDPKIKAADLVVNNDLVDRIKKLSQSNASYRQKLRLWMGIDRKTPFIKEIAGEKFKAIADNIMNDLSKHEEQNAQKTTRNLSRRGCDFIKNRALIHTSIDTEIDAQAKNQFLLWRGEANASEFSQKDTTPAERYQWASGKPISYGSSLLGGRILDQSACAYSYMVPGGTWAATKEPVGYVLPISKQDYLSGATGNMVHIPVVGAMGNLALRGSWWHPRTKVPTSNRMHQIPTQFRMSGEPSQKKETVNAMLNKIHEDFIPLTPGAEEMKKNFTKKDE